MTAAATAILLATVSAADAATLFSDDFGDGDATGWTTSGGTWSVTSGSYSQSGTGAAAKALAGTSSWADYSLQARVRPDAFGTNSSRGVGIAARAQSTSSFYQLLLTPNAVQLRRGSTTIGSAALAVSTSTTASPHRRSTPYTTSSCAT